MSALGLTLTWEGHRVRMGGTPERPEWVARDVCRALQIHHAADALRNAGIAPAERGRLQVDTPGGPQQVTTIIESGVWKLVLISRRPAAVRFREWLTREVLPSLRQHGCYPPPAERPAPPLPDLRDHKQLAALTLQLTLILAEKDQRIQELEPRAEEADRLLRAEGTVSLMTAGRILGRQPRLLMKTLEADGVLVRGERGRLMPAATYREQGLFVVREILVDVASERDVDGKGVPQTLVTTRGLAWLASRYPATDARGEVEARVDPGRGDREPPSLASAARRALAGTAAEHPRLDFSPRKRETEH